MQASNNNSAHHSQPQQQTSNAFHRSASDSSSGSSILNEVDAYFSKKGAKMGPAATGTDTTDIWGVPSSSVATSNMITTVGLSSHNNYMMPTANDNTGAVHRADSDPTDWNFTFDDPDETATTAAKLSEGGVLVADLEAQLHSSAGFGGDAKFTDLQNNIGMMQANTHTLLNSAPTTGGVQQSDSKRNSMLPPYGSPPLSGGSPTKPISAGLSNFPAVSGGGSTLIHNNTASMDAKSSNSSVNGNRSPAMSHKGPPPGYTEACLLYTSDAADEEDSVDLGGRRIIKKKKIIITLYYIYIMK
eukprot:TRINITY_DN27122_c0_g1_i1.p1 TRINITY_DN27122_c0_g1~~TRINITY_DN27122_c0_g1_i1.p1  ORF type:complete len:301 (+),score=96.96 TRINITY_DN27122_c0_g1_i1:412-1314(+)